LKRMVRLPIVGRLPERESLEKATVCGSEARRPVWLAEGFAGEARAPGENWEEPTGKCQRKGHTLYLKVRCGSGCRFGARKRHTKKRAGNLSHLLAREKQKMTPAY